MKSILELRQAREDLEKQMIEAANSEEEIIRKRILEFLDRMKDEYGFYNISYEIWCKWEDGDLENAIGLDDVVISNV